VVIGVLVGWVVLVPAGPSAAAATCTYSANDHRVDVTITAPAPAPANPYLFTGLGGSINLSHDGVTDPCGGADVNDTDTIRITDTSADNTFMQIQLEGSGFAPGFTPEGDATPEIEFQVDLGAGDGDTLFINGVGTPPFTIHLGSTGLNLNDDADGDMTISGIELVTVGATVGNDLVSGAGGSGTGDPFPIHMQADGLAGLDTLTCGLARCSLNGGDGQDDLTGSPEEDGLQGGEGVDMIFGLGGVDFITGGSENDTLFASAGIDNVFGGDGDDVIAGGGGRDQLNGEGQADKVRGNAGKDRVVGGEGNDQLKGNQAPDRLLGQAGDDLLNGGAAEDRCNGGPGRNTLRNCELRR
jgi:Ca2+-binding RTX toxin-like protein